MPMREEHDGLLSLVESSREFDEAAIVMAARIAMRPMDHAAAAIVFVFTVNENVFADA